MAALRITTILSRYASKFAEDPAAAFKPFGGGSTTAMPSPNHLLGFAGAKPPAPYQPSTQMPAAQPPATPPLISNAPYNPNRLRGSQFGGGTTPDPGYVQPQAPPTSKSWLGHAKDVMMSPMKPDAKVDVPNPLSYVFPEKSDAFDPLHRGYSPTPLEGITSLAGPAGMTLAAEGKLLPRLLGPGQQTLGATSAPRVADTARTAYTGGSSAYTVDRGVTGGQGTKTLQAAADVR